MPGSLKARLCVRGARADVRVLRAARDRGHERCGKLIVATREEELPGLDELERRGKANGVPGLRRVGADELARDRAARARAWRRCTRRTPASSTSSGRPRARRRRARRRRRDPPGLRGARADHARRRRAAASRAAGDESRPATRCSAPAPGRTGSRSQPGADGGPAHRAVPRRLPARCAPSARDLVRVADLPGARPGAAVPRRAPHPPRRRRGARSGPPRCLPPRATLRRGAPPRTSLDARLARHPADGAPLVAHRPDRDQARRSASDPASATPSATCPSSSWTTCGPATSASAPRRSAATAPDRRLRLRPDRARAARPQRAVARRHLLAGDRARDRRQAGAGDYLTAAGPCAGAGVSRCTARIQSATERGGGAGPYTGSDEGTPGPEVSSRHAHGEQAPWPHGGTRSTTTVFAPSRRRPDATVRPRALIRHRSGRFCPAGATSVTWAARTPAARFTVRSEGARATTAPSGCTPWAVHSARCCGAM